VPPDIELLDLVAADIGAPHVTQAVAEGGTGQLLSDDDGHAAEDLHDRGHARRVLGRKKGLLGRQVLGQRDGRVGHLADSSRRAERRRVRAPWADKRYSVTCALAERGELIAGL
jgi:hypothetical protein